MKNSDDFLTPVRPGNWDQLRNDEKKKICRSYRDVLFKCLDEKNDDEQECQSELKEVVNHCPKSWVKWFLGKRAYDIKKKDRFHAVFESPDESTGKVTKRKDNISVEDIRRVPEFEKSAFEIITSYFSKDKK